MILPARGDVWPRCLVVTVGTAATCALAVLGIALLPLWRSEPTIPETTTIETGLVEIPAPSPPPAASVAPPPSPEPAPIAPPEDVAPPPPPKPAPRPKAVPRHTAPVAPQPSSTPAAPAAPSSDAPPPTPDQGLAGGTSGARAIFQPAPVIPPELRRHAMDFVAVVRFSIAGDGHASAELVEATPVPQLNQVLLDTFQRWRFFPAMQSGKPVASTLVLKVPVSIE